MTQEAFETKEVRGISLKFLYTIIAATVLIVSSVVLSYSKLAAQIAKQESQSMNDGKYNDLRMRQLEINVQALEVQIAEIIKQVNNNSSSISKIK